MNDAHRNPPAAPAAQAANSASIDVSGVAVRRLDASSADFQSQFAQLLERDASTDAGIATAVADIIAQVRGAGDAALLELTRRFDRVPASTIDALRIDRDECRDAWEALPQTQREALQIAADRIRVYHERQRGTSWEYVEPDGTRLGQRVLPLDRVGLYVPGGKAAYPSSVLMNAIPARVAGVGQLAMVVPTPDGERNPMLLAAAHLAGIDEIWAIGGAQAVAALAWGTESIAPVDKIVGPGNAYVAEAKRRAFGAVGIDMIAGPSEILVVGDASVPADWIALDLFSQAEHDEMAQAILISGDLAWLDAVQAAIERLLPQMPRRDVIARSLADRGMLIHAQGPDAIADLVNRVAPEHLELAVRDPSPLLDRIRHAGAIFVGRNASESLGDYCAGPSHVLPTMRTARFSSPLGVPDFQKRSSLIDVSAQGAQRLGPVAATLARGEGLEAHARSAEARVVSTAATAVAAVRPDTAAERSERLVRDEIAAIGAYHVPPLSDGVIKLDAMENPYAMPQPLREELGRRLADVALNRYPQARHQALEGLLRNVFGLPESSGLVIGNGSDELIAMLTTLLARPGARMLVPAPTFVMYRMTALFSGLELIDVPLDEDFQLDEAAMLDAIERHRPALVFLAYPNNPTGACWNRDSIRAVLRASTGLVVVDEAYEPFAPDSWMDSLDEFPNLVVLRTLSKWGLAGVRLGFLAGARPWTDALEKVRPPYNVSVLNEVAARFALEHADVFAAQAARLREDREKLIVQLQRLPGLERVYHSDANFVLVRVAGQRGEGSRVAQAMREAGVQIKDTDKMAPALFNTLRLTVGTPDQNERMLASLQAALGTPA